MEGNKETIGYYKGFLKSYKVKVLGFREGNRYDLEKNKYAIEYEDGTVEVVDAYKVVIKE